MKRDPFLRLCFWQLGYNRTCSVVQYTRLLSLQARQSITTPFQVSSLDHNCLKFHERIQNVGSHRGLLGRYDVAQATHSVLRGRISSPLEPPMNWHLVGFIPRFLQEVAHVDVLAKGHTAASARVEGLCPLRPAAKGTGHHRESKEKHVHVQPQSGRQKP